MDQTEENEWDDGKNGTKKDVYFIVDSWSSEDEGQKSLGTCWDSCKQIKRLSRESSPPLLLVFSNSGKPPQTSFLDAGADLQKDEDSHLPIEDWMILNDEEQEGDSSIQLNLSYSNTLDDSRDNDMTEVKSVNDAWAVSKKDKDGAKLSMPTCNSWANDSLVCQICNRMGHLTKNCYLKKYPTCPLCGKQGHIQKACSDRPCPTCGRPSHTYKPCEIPPMWDQHCQRCGMMGHLFDACPDTWRQFHLTISPGMPFKPQTTQNLESKRHSAYCYNCGKRGHYGYECTKRRMVSGTFPSLPFVHRYDTMEDILHCCPRVQQRRAKELVRGGLPSDPEWMSEKQSDCTGENLFTQSGRGRRKQQGSNRKKTWPERRKKKREAKQMRREAQAIREGSLVGQSHEYDYETCPMNSFGHPLPGYGHFIPRRRMRRGRGTGLEKKI